MTRRTKIMIFLVSQYQWLKKFQVLKFKDLFSYIKNERMISILNDENY